MLGGSAAINGLYMVRQNRLEQETWASLASGGSSSSNASSLWGWDTMFTAMKKSETFAPPTSEVQQQLGNSIAWDAASHGTSGPVHSSWPGRTYNSVSSFVQAAASVNGVGINRDPYSGNNLGAFVATSSIDPSTWKRSFSRTGYIDPILDSRSNLHILTGHQATQLVLEKSNATDLVVARGVRYAQGPGEQTHVVSARREVILSAGAIGSPTLLQRSGIAGSDLLASVGIEQVVDLPGVGYHLQDHLAGGVGFGVKASTAKPQTVVSGNAIEDSHVNSAIAYVSLETLLGSPTEAETFRASLRSSLDAAVDALDAPAAVKAGYRATYTAQVDQLFSAGSGAGPIELLFANTFGQIQVQAALQHPLSRGSVRITSADAFAAPRIDAAYLAHSADLQLLRAGFRLARLVGQTSPLSDLLTGAQGPAAAAQTDSEWDTFIRGNTQTEYHPTASCSMLPRQQGGVVDPDMRVYGTSNVRVIDASIPPLSMAMHLMTATYGLAELGADMIKATRVADDAAATLGNDQSNNSNPGSNQSAATGGSNKQSSAKTRLTLNGLLPLPLLLLPMLLL